MYCVFWYGKCDRSASSVWLQDRDDAWDISEAMRKDGWKVAWTRHGTLDCSVMPGYKTAAAELRKARNEE